MPKYDYKCEGCGNSTTISKPMKEVSKEERCTKCDTKLKRVFNATPNSWKVGGAYVTNNR
jgi:putative FmdB family regulatory protein